MLESEPLPVSNPSPFFFFWKIRLYYTSYSLLLSLTSSHVAKASPQQVALGFEAVR